MAGQPRTREREGREPRPGARGYTNTHPPFEPGNTMALQHGADSPRMVAPLAAKVAETLPVVAPWTTRAAFAGARESYCWTEAQLALLRAYLDEHGILDGEGQPRPAAGRLDRLEARAASLRTELGLTPHSLGRLLALLASVASATGDEDGLAALKAEGARIRESHAKALTEGES